LLLQDSQEPMQGGLVKISIDFKEVTTLEMQTECGTAEAQRLPVRQGYFNQGKLGNGSVARPLFADPVGQRMVGKMVPAAILPAG